MFQPTDAHRAEVLSAYRLRRVQRAETPWQAMSGLSDVFAHAAMMTLVDGKEVQPSLLGWWSAARAYAAAMQGRSPYWFEHITRRRSCTSARA